MKGEPGKAPAFQFYVKDWLTDPELRLTKASTRGIWIDLLCFMWESNKKGVLELDAGRIMKLTGADKDEAELFLKEAKDLEFCDFFVTSNGMSQICNRRMSREAKAREINRIRQQKHREKKARNADVIHQKGGAPSPSPTPTPIPTTKNKEIYTSVCSLLNELTNKKFKSTSSKTRRLIDTRIKDGFSLNDFFTVINNQCEKWQNDSKMNQYLRPETLFGTKFESYLNNTPNRMEGQVSDLTLHNMKILDEWDNGK